MLLAPIAAGYFLSIRATVIATIISVSTLIGLYFLETNGLVSEPSYSQSQIEIAALFLLSVTTLMCGLAAAVFSHSARTALERANQSNDELELIFQHVPIRLWMKDEHNRILRLNQQAADSMGLSVEDAEGACTYDLFPDMAAKYHKDDLEVIEQGEPKLGIIETYTPKDNQAGWVRTDKVPFTNERGERFVFVAALDITDQIKQREDLKKSEERYQLAISGASGGIWDLDLVNDKTHYSSRNYHMLGEDEYDVVDPKAWWNERIHHNDREIVTRALDEHFVNRLPFDVKYRIRHNDGSWRWWRSRGKAVRNSAQKPVRMIGINSDVTELVEAQIRAEIANDAKSRFLANVSHEIRTPLNGVLGMAQALQHSPLNEQQAKSVEIILHSGTALSGVLNDVLDISKAEARELTLDIQKTDLTALLSSSVVLFESNARANGISLSWRNAIETPIMVEVDDNRLRQILNNLLSNAVKFTKAGSVELSLAFDKTNGETDTVFTFSVSDTGVGIPQEYLDTVFEPFKQGDSATTRKFGGTGLGLSVTRSLVELMGGSIDIISELGKGTTFTVSIPLRCVDDIDHVDRKPESTSIDHDSSKQLKILLAEDNEINQLVVQELLKSQNVDLTIVTNGAQAVDRLENEDFDLVLMDVQMPVMDGVDATKVIRQREVQNQRATTPLLMLTANVMGHQVEMYREAGADGFIAKPISEADLFSSIQHHTAA